MSYTVEMHHDEASFTALSKMQYNLFCQTNRIGRSLISFALMLTAIACLDHWWAYLLLVYAVYLVSSMRMTATRAARKLTQQIEENNMPWPASRLTFGDEALRITSLPVKKGEEDTVLAYGDVCRLAEDAGYLYVFRDKFGGYMAPKSALKDAAALRVFLEKKTGKPCLSGSSPLRRLLSVRRMKQDTAQ